jgi:putative ABC transport system permease protein
MSYLLPSLRAWWLLCLSTVITISIVTASQLFTHRIGLFLDRQASELLAADLLLQSSEQLPADFISRAQSMGLDTATTVSLRTAIFIADEAQLVELKAVSDAYPLRGALEVQHQALGESERVARGPQPGEVWIDSKLAAQLNQSLELGLTSVRATKILSYEPDRGGTLFNLAPRVLMHIDDLAATGLLVPGSRARHHLLVAGKDNLVKQFEQSIKPELEKGQELQTIENARPEMRNALDRTRKFFAFSIVLTLVIAMIATAITARYAASQETIKVAVLRTFGIAGSKLLGYYSRQILKIWLWSLPAGLGLGYLAQFPLQGAMGLWFGTRLPETDISPYLLASLIGFVSLVGFSFPHILNVLDSPPMQVLRQIRSSMSRKRSLFLLTSSLVTLFLVLMLIIDHFMMATALFVVILLIATLIPLILKLILSYLQKLNDKRFWLSGYILSRLLSTQRNALFVMTGFIITLLSVLLISQVKDQLLEDWEKQLPNDKPNYFLVNISSQDVGELTSFLQTRQIPTSGAYPLVRTRLQEINDQDVTEMEFGDVRARHLIDHTFNISHSDKLPPDNEIIEGEWLDNNSTRDGFSVEQGMAQKLGLKLGDRLRFSVAGSSFEGPVANIRSVVWENFRPNFYILASQDQLQAQPQTWLMSAFISAQNKPLLKPMLQKFPTITLLDISEIMQRIKSIIERASMALEFFFVFASLSAIIVLLSALNTANHNRKMEIALLLALGANNRHKLRSQLFEFIAMGFIVGLFAAAFATLTGWMIGYFFFDLPFVFRPGLWLSSVAVSILVITLVGVSFIYRSFSISPMHLLRS